MISNLFSGGNNHAVKLCEIRLDEDHLVFKGPEGEAPDAVLKGVLVLCLTEPLRVQEIKLRFTGELRASIRATYPDVHANAKREERFFRHAWRFEGAKTLVAGNHEWPFELQLKSDLPESIEGLLDSWVIYRLKATIDRGAFAKNVLGRKHIRIIRTFGVDSLELSHEMVTLNSWKDKIDYRIVTPAKGVALGFPIKTEFSLIPVKKGLRIGTVTCSLEQQVDVSVEDKSGSTRNKTGTAYTVAKDEWQFPDDMETERLDEHGQEGYRFVRNLIVPRQLTKCMQTVEQKGIRIKHTIKYIVQLFNPEGHVSELRCQMPIHIFLSPDARLSAANEMVGNPVEPLAVVEAPPEYGHHQLDMLYQDVDPSRYHNTPAASGFNTPNVLSRRPSITDLEEQQDDEEDAVRSQEIAANTLANRLNELTNPVSSSWSQQHRFGSYGSSGPTSPAAGILGQLQRNTSFPGLDQAAALAIASRPNLSRLGSTFSIGGQSQTHSRHPSGERVAPPTPGVPAEHYIEDVSSGERTRVEPSGHDPGEGSSLRRFDTTVLSRVPSYNTASHGAAHPVPISNDLPSYDVVMRGPRS